MANGIYQGTFGFFMTVMLLFLLLAVSAVLSSSVKPKTLKYYNHGHRRACSTSPNTQTLIYVGLKHFPVAVEHLRAGPDVLCSLMASIKSKAKEITARNYNSSAASGIAPLTIEDPRQLTLKELFSNAWDRADYLVEEVLVELYNDYPDIDHINTLLYDGMCTVSLGLLHVAVKTCNTTLISIFKRDYGNVIDYNLRDSEGISPAELADLEESTKVFKHLVQTFPKIVHEPFMAHISLVHHAAHQNRVDLIEFVDQLDGAYDFTKLYHDTYGILTPLEIALKEQSFDVARILIKKGAPIRSEILQIIYTSFMDTVNLDSRPILFLLAHCGSTLMYFKNQEGMDVMQLAIELRDERLVKDLFDLGYSADLENLSNITSKGDIQNLIMNRNK